MGIQNRSLETAGLTKPVDHLSGADHIHIGLTRTDLQLGDLLR